MQSEKIYNLIGNNASLYDTFLNLTGHKKSVEFFVSKLPFNENDSFDVLDAGCGTGLYPMAILKKFKNAHVAAFDFDKKSVERLKEKVSENSFEDRAHLFVADIQGELDEIIDQKFDLIITSGVLEYVDLIKTIKNLSVFLNSGGYFFNSPIRNMWLGKIISKLYACKIYSQSENIKAFEQNNFKLEKIIYLPVYSPSSFKEGNLFRKK